eukprot:m.14585 g.14585  ORF g.14585 m.14585 type:complete len:106 (+) comp5150_c0_seq1:40-357(+)
MNIIIDFVSYDMYHGYHHILTNIMTWLPSHGNILTLFHNNLNTYIRIMSTTFFVCEYYVNYLASVCFLFATTDQISELSCTRASKFAANWELMSFQAVFVARLCL